MDPNIKEMLEAGVMDETEVPFETDDASFNDADNEYDEVKIPYTLELANPFKFGESGGEITQLVFVNEPTTAMTMHLPIHGMPKRGHMVPVVAGMLGKPDAFVKQIRPHDFLNCINIVYHFF